MIKLIDDDELELFGNRWLLDEYKRLAEELRLRTCETILGHLTTKIHEVATLREDFVARCRSHLPEGEEADVVHAATCLQLGATLITNDRDFSRVRDARLIEVWSMSEAIRRLLIQE